MSDIAVAVQTFIARRDRTQHPAGSFDKKSRWYPNESEQQSCCSAIRGPSRAWPYSLMTHCRTAVHVASLYGVTARDIRRAARAN